MIFNKLRACISIVLVVFLNQVLQEVERLGYKCIISQKAANIQPYLIQSWLVFYQHFLLSGNAVTRKKDLYIKKLNSNTQ